MRIIAGKYRGRQLVTFKADHIRPTTDRVKESIFNILQGAVADTKVLDLFSGTGNLAIEALSRGAASVVAVELNKKSVEIIRENQTLLKIGTELKVITLDVFRYLQGYEGEGFDLVFIDPPFTEKIGDKVMQAVARSRVFAEHTVIVIESGGSEPINDQYGDLKRIDVREYGDKTVSFFRKDS